MNELAVSPELNKKILKYARRSPEEIAELIGIPADEAAERLARLLDTPVRDLVMEKRLIIKEIGFEVERIKERLDEGVWKDEDFAKISQALTANLKLLLDQIDKQSRVNDEMLEKVNEAQASLMVRAIQLAAENAGYRLREMFPEADPYLLEQIFEEELPKAMAVIEDATV